MHHLLFSGALWTYTLFGLALHVADVRRRHHLARMPLDHYMKGRPAEWLLSGLLLFSAGAAVIAGMEFQAWLQGSRPAAPSYRAFAAAAVVALALTVLGVRCAAWMRWAREEFLTHRGVTSPSDGVVSVNVAAEAERDAGLLRQFAWIVYSVGTAPGLLAAYELRKASPQFLTLVAMGDVAGAFLVLALVLSLPRKGKSPDDV